MPGSRGSVIFMDSTFPSAKKIYALQTNMFQSASLMIPVSGFGTRNPIAAFCFELSFHVSLWHFIVLPRPLDQAQEG